MDLTEAIKKRRSIRKYLPRKVENDKLDRVLEAGRLAPSAKNLQEWRFVVVRDEGRRKRLAEAAKGQPFVGEAPVMKARLITCEAEGRFRTEDIFETVVSMLKNLPQRDTFSF
jgi:nitroreductase